MCFNGAEVHCDLSLGRFAVVPIGTFEGGVSLLSGRVGWCVFKRFPGASWPTPSRSVNAKSHEQLFDTPRRAAFLVFSRESEMMHCLNNMPL